MSDSPVSRRAGETCPSCGGTSLAGASPAICVRCALGFALEDSGDENPIEPEIPVEGGAFPARRIGPYRLRSVLGEGGMGVVWEAEQQEPVRRRVAVKCLRIGLDSAQFLARFDSERQALALMSHPNIARAFDAGCTAEGHPYFAMELVEGPWITRYCDAENLDIRRRLELFVEVCHGIQHAHQRGVIHRDIKPSNILMQSEQGRPVPKIIDFGVAKAMGSHLTDRTLVTRIGQMIGTPEYMSPEQAGPAGFDVDTRTDVYSLGAVLFELLAGQLPFGLAEGDGDELRRRIREEEPTRPSARVELLGQGAMEIARRRSAEPTSLARALKGDLDWIVLKALAKDRARRYGTPDELAADIGRYLGNEPISARPPSLTYQLRKFAQRNRTLVASILGVALALTSGIAASTLLYFRSEEARQEATAVAQFLGGMITDVSPNGGNKDITVRAALDRASVTVGDRFQGEPLVEAYLHQVIANSYQGLGMWSEAEMHAATAERLRREILGREDPLRLESMRQLAFALDREAKYEQANAVLDELIPLSRRILGDESPETLATLFRKGVVLLEHGETGEGATIHRQVYEVRRRVLGKDHPDTLWSAYYVAESAIREDNPAVADPILREVIRDRTRILGPEHPDTLHAMNSLAWALFQEGKFAESAEEHRRTLEIRRRVLGDLHPDTLRSMHNLADPLEVLGRHEEAQKLYLEAIAGYRKTLGEDHPRVWSCMNQYAWGLLTAEPRSLRDPKAALAIAEQVVDKTHRGNSYFLHTLALAQLETGDTRGAVATQQAALALLPSGASVIGPELEADLAQDILEARRFPQLKLQLLFLREKQPGSTGDLPRRLHQFMSLVIDFYDALNSAQPGHGYQMKAAQWKAKLDGNG